MQTFLAKLRQIKFGNIPPKKVIIQHGQVRFIQKHKLGLTFEKKSINIIYHIEMKEEKKHISRGIEKALDEFRHAFMVE